MKYTQTNRANLVISVKPFGCMPSSGVSDGIQSEITEKYPDSHFIAIETSGDCSANVYSRVQMALHKAKQKAEQELAAANAQHKPKMSDKKQQTITQYPKHKFACTSANFCYSNR